MRSTINYFVVFTAEAEGRFFPQLESAPPCPALLARLPSSYQGCGGRSASEGPSPLALRPTC